MRKRTPAEVAAALEHAKTLAESGRFDELTRNYPVAAALETFTVPELTAWLETRDVRPSSSNRFHILTVAARTLGYDQTDALEIAGIAR